jgi:hypothetical protein
VKRPRLLGIDDAPFRKGQQEPVPIVAVVMEGALLVEGIAIGSFPVDGDGATDYLARWVGGMRWHPALQAVLLGGATIAGLGIVDIAELSERLGLPVLSMTRQGTEKSDLANALRAAGLADRIAILERIPPSRAVRSGIHIACAGASDEEAEEILRASLHVSKVPEPIRIAHLVGAALVAGASKGRV